MLRSKIGPKWNSIDPERMRIAVEVVTRGERNLISLRTLYQSLTHLGFPKNDVDEYCLLFSVKNNCSNLNVVKNKIGLTEIKFCFKNTSCKRM